MKTYIGTEGLSVSQLIQLLSKLEPNRKVMVATKDGSVRFANSASEINHVPNPETLNHQDLPYTERVVLIS